MTFRWLLESFFGKPMTEQEARAAQERQEEEERVNYEFLTGGLHPDHDPTYLETHTEQEMQEERAHYEFLSGSPHPDYDPLYSAAHREQQERQEQPVSVAQYRHGCSMEFGG